MRRELWKVFTSISTPEKRGAQSAAVTDGPWPLDSAAG